MRGNLGLLGAAGGDGGGASSGGSTSGFGSTLSKEDNLVLASEESSSYPDESDIELGLGLSLGGGGFKSKAVPWSQHGRILTAEDLPSSIASKSSVKSPPPSSSSSSSSSSSMTKANFSAGTKRTADSISPSPANRSVSQVAGWPPVGAYRMNSFVNQAKLPASEEFHSPIKQTKSKNGVVDMSNGGVHKNNNSVEDKGKLKTSLFVKVNKDGIAIGRKVDLSAHSCYEKLAQTLEDMFCRSAATVGVRQPSMEEHSVKTEATGPLSKLLDGSSEFVLTYEDNDGDWMLVGDVPWGMFISSVKRLRIMRTAEANGLGAIFQGRNGRQSKPV